ncbi:MAG: thioredoxin fold domain-containing protein [Pseudoxanthomonas sp.]
MKRMLLCAAIGGLSLAACAQAPQTPAATTPAAKPASAADKVADDRVRQALKALNPKLQVDYIGAAPMQGFRQAVVGGSVVFVSDDGRYLVQGDVIDLQTRRNVGDSNAGLAAYRRSLLQGVPHAQRIVFAPPNPKYTVSVFTDIECGYCRKLHSQIADYNKQGIAIEYLAFPRMGLNTKDHKDMVSVWCAADPKSALTAAKSGKPTPARNCDNPVASEYALGQRLGVTGTPAVFAPDGTQIGGYLTPAQMRAVLDGLSGAAGGSR